MEISIRPYLHRATVKNDTAKLVLAISVDGIFCGDMVVCSGFSTEDTCAVLSGDKKLGELTHGKANK
jgi:hypothetical protein